MGSSFEVSQTEFTLHTMVEGEIKIFSWFQNRFVEIGNNSSKRTCLILFDCDLFLFLTGNFLNCFFSSSVKNTKITSNIRFDMKPYLCHVCGNGNLYNNLYILFYELYPFHFLIIGNQTSTIDLYKHTRSTHTHAHVCICIFETIYVSVL